MSDPRRATNEERRQIKDAVLEAIGKDPGWPAIDVGEVLVSIGAAMVKASNVERQAFLDNAARAWDAQKRLAPPGGPN